jgi:hypothetical protein
MIIINWLCRHLNKLFEEANNLQANLLLYVWM